MTDHKRPDLHHSQPVHVADVLDDGEKTGPVPRIPLTGEDAERRIQEQTRDQQYLLIFRQILKHHEIQIKLTREMTAALADVRDQGHVERDTLLMLKDIGQEMRVLRESSGSNAAVLNVASEIRDLMRQQLDAITALHDFLQIRLTNGSS